MKKHRYAIDPFPSDKPKTAKERKAQRLAMEAKADFLSAISDINNEYGTNYTHENLLRESE
jgi:hypothetical protein